LLQDIPSSDPVDQDEEETQDTVGVAAEKSVSPPPTTGEVVAGLARQGTGTDNSQASAEEGRPNPSPSVVVEQSEEVQAVDEAATEAGIVNIASLLGAPTMTAARSTL
jgi:hypothetical protein